MNRFVSLYLVVFAIICILAFIASLEDTAVIIMATTFGLGLPLLMIPINLAAWMAIGLPLVVSFKVGHRWAIGTGAAISLAIAYAILVLPVSIARSDLNTVIQTLTDDDTVGSVRSDRFAGIEIRDLTRALEAPPCDALCAGLLVGGQADWVRVVTPSSRSNELIEQVFTASTGDFCRPAERCPVIAKDTGTEAELVIETGPLVGVKDQNARLNARLARLKSGVRLKIVETASDSLLFQETAVTYWMASYPIFWVPEFHGLRPKGISVHKTLTRRTVAPAISALRDIGLTVKPQAAPRRHDSKSYTRLPTSVETSAVLALLDRPKGEKFDDVDQGVIRDYISKARWFPDDQMPDLHRDIVTRIFQEPRFDGPSNLDHLLGDDATLRARVLPLMMDGLEKDALIPVATRTDFLMALRYSYTPDTLAPYYEQYGRILSSVYSNRSYIWYAPVGRFGSDPRPFIEASNRTGKRRLEMGLAALCHSEPEWEAGLAELLWQDVQTYGESLGPNTRVEWPFADSLKVLVWAGYRTKVDRWLTSIDMGGRFRNSFDRIDAKTPKYIVCQ